MDKKNLTGQIHNAIYQNVRKKGWGECNRSIEGFPNSANFTCSIACLKNALGNSYDC